MAAGSCWKSESLRKESFEMHFFLALSVLLKKSFRLQQKDIPRSTWTWLVFEVL